MNETALDILLATAATVGIGHTLLGIDHSLPFIALARARGWSLRQALGVTALCGVGHVLSSVLLGSIGIALGVATEKLTTVEAARGGLAAQMLVVFGLLYAALAWWKRRRHDHFHADDVGHDAAIAPSRTSTIWALFILFVLGPCEALIPMLMVPAAAHAWVWVLAVVGVFALATVGTMLVTVAVGLLSLNRARMRGLAPYADVVAGLSIAGSGVAIQLLGI